MKRGRTLRVPESWLEKCAAYKDRTRKSLRVLGTELANAAGRAKPYSTSAVHDYLSGRAVTEEMTRAWATLMGLPLPVLVPDDADLQRWCELGALLKREAPDRFRRELEALQEFVDALKKYSSR